MSSDDSLTHQWHFRGRTITFTWLGDIDVVASRVYALAFTGDGRMLLVAGRRENPQYWLPGGGVEEGESAEAALARELQEEAGASVESMKALGVQHAEDDGWLSGYHRFYWCRIALSDHYAPEHEIGRRKLVAESDFLDELFWGRTDPKAEMLLARSLEAERRYRDSGSDTSSRGRDEAW
jgi:ADP-ribose pyrophosphatase YjhB (NUDIX family)